MNPSDDHSFELPDLSPNDRRLLDALIEAEFDRRRLEPLSAAAHERLDAIERLLGLLHDYPVEDADETLVNATLARIDRHERQREDRLRIETRMDEARGGARRLRLPDVITVAAVMLIAASIALPILSNVRQRSIDASCANNLRVMGFAFDQYARDYDGVLPMSFAGFSGAWRSNTRNHLHLNPLVTGGYCSSGHLNCPNHPYGIGEPAYSYQWQSAQPQLWGVAPHKRIVMGDRNPVVDAYRAGDRLSAMSSSANHNGRGQNVLADDGATVWLEAPIIGRGDNIWLPAGASTLGAGLLPTEDDTFLVH